MASNSDVSNVNRRQFLAVASGVAAAASSFAVGKDSPSAQATSHPLKSTSYVVTIDVTTTPISYTYPDPTNSSLSHNGYRLKVMPGDTVTWKVTTATKIYNAAILFVHETPLDDANNKPAKYMVSGSNTTPIAAITIDTDALGTYEYYVAVDDGSHTYTDDPKIIVGGAGGYESKAEIIEDARVVIKEARRLKSAAPSNSDLKETMDSIEKKLGQVIDRLE